MTVISKDLLATKFQVGDKVRVDCSFHDDEPEGVVDIVAFGVYFPYGIRFPSGATFYYNKDELELITKAEPLADWEVDLLSGLSDSGRRVTTDNGFTREPDDDRPDLTRIFSIDGIELVPVEMLERVAAHYKKGAVKYSADNWRLGTTDADLARIRRSTARHIFAWFKGETDEDHAAAITFNVWAHEVNSGEVDHGTEPAAPRTQVA